MLKYSRVMSPEEELSAMSTQSALKLDDREALTEAFGLFNEINSICNNGDVFPVPKAHKNLSYDRYAGLIRNRH